MVTRLLEPEFKLALNLPFLNLLYDLWTTDTGKKCVLGASLSFIGSDWSFHHIALLVTVFNGSHGSYLVKNMMLSRIVKLYGVSIGAMAQFLMSDTDPSAPKVSKLFEDSAPRHTCPDLFTGWGCARMWSQLETICVVDPDTNVTTKQRRVFTMREHSQKALIWLKKVRSLNNYFKTPQRVDRLTKIQRFYGLPELTAMVDCDTRVASTVTLSQ
ncbi:hypothetical protein PF008_g19917 [Phytophthora fragariae]|uniref:Uncharacterized protein n=1 Tax=Phytophthora fragariae TaxID=53985 RepID=A0A6G0R152_9STRA|nr:hypothetical protein PF008_g19917 [Phytophthora fragariae]